MAERSRVDRPERGHLDHVRELAVTGPRRSGANAMITDVAPNQPLDHAAVLRFGNQIRTALRYSVLHNPNFGNRLSFRQLSVVDSDAMIRSLNPEAVWGTLK